MDIFKGYVKSVADFVSSLGDSVEPSEELKHASISSEDTKLRSELDKDTESSVSKSIFGWFPKYFASTSENAVLYYTNPFATMGSSPGDERNTERSNGPEVGAKIITEDITEVQLPSSELDAADCPTSLENQTESNWISDISSRTGEVWHQIKQDFTEVVNAVTEPKQAVLRTASTVCDRITNVAVNTAKSIKPDEIILPENKTNMGPGSDELKEDDPSRRIATPPELPSIPQLKSDLTQLVSSVRTGLLSTGAFFTHLTNLNGSSSRELKDRREARLDILRADPATYELCPPPPPKSSGLHSYSDWRAAYFDENTCQPMPGIPLADARDPAYAGLPTEELTQPAHRSPAELLDAYPFMRTYLTQLVNPDDQRDRKSITDADFWSRYYYRVWLLDSSEFRRRRLAERVEAVSTVQSSHLSWSPYSGADGEGETDTANDWFDTSDPEDIPFYATKQKVSGISSHVSVTESQFNSDTTPYAKNLEANSTVPQCQSDSLPPDGSIQSSPIAFEKKRHKKKKQVKKPTKQAEHEPVQPSKLENIDVQGTQQLVTPPNVNATNSSNIFSDFEDMTSGSSSIVILSNNESPEDDLLTTDLTLSIQNNPFTLDVEKPIYTEDWGDTDNEDLGAADVLGTEAESSRINRNHDRSGHNSGSSI